MGEYSVKLDRLIPVMSDYIGKLQTFDSIVTNENKTGAVREILTLAEDLRNSLKINSSINYNQTQTLYSNQIERIFSEFNWNVNYTIKRNEFSKVLGCCKSLASSVMKIIGKRNCGILIVEMHFQMCIKLVNELYHSVEENTNVLKDLLLFQLLVKGFSSSFRSLKKFWYVIIPSKRKCSVLLCVSQCFKTLCFLGKVVDKRLKQLILYLLNRLKQCINKIFDNLYDREEETSNSEFINLMDACLGKLEKLGYNINVEEDVNDEMDEIVSSLKVLLDELLCHGMIVGHVSTREIDCNSIKLHSQKVLDEFENLTKIENRCDIKSNCDSLCDILCQLEEVVNIAVLNAVLDLFIGINDPLKNLLNKCDLSGDGATKMASDLEDEITDFDKLMDKIINIGLFAISCTTDVVRTFKIRNCLASLESLEEEVITSIVSLYLNPNSETRSTFQFLFRNWMEEVTELKTLMDLIIDPAAFSQVVVKRISALVYELRNDSHPEDKMKSSLSQILSYSKKLLKTIARSTEHDDEEIRNKIKASIESLQLAHQECSASLKLLDEDTPGNEILNRILKRADLIISSINNLINSINESWNDPQYLDGDSFDDWLAPSLQPHKWEKDNEKFDKLDIYKLNAITPEPEDQIDQEILTPYINKGKLRSKEWTIMYTTPKRKQSTPGVINSTNRPDIPRGSYRRKRFCKTLSNNSELENSLDLELTALLENVTDLDDTFATTIGKNKKEPENDEDVYPLRGEEIPAFPVAKPENPGDEKVFLGTLMREKLDRSLSDLSNSDSLSIRMDSDCRYETPERMNDLGIVQKKINFLMEHIND